MHKSGRRLPSACFKKAKNRLPTSQPRANIARISVENVCSWRGAGWGERIQTGAAWAFRLAPSPAARHTPVGGCPSPRVVPGLLAGRPTPPGGSRVSVVGFPVLRLTVLGSSGATCC